MLLVGLALGGCLEGAAPPTSPTPPAAGADFTRVEAPPLAFHLWSTCGLCFGAPRYDDPEQRAFIVFEDGRAILVSYNVAAPEDKTFHVADDVALDHAWLGALLKEAQLAAEERHEGGWVAHVARGTLPGPVVQELRRALRDDWSVPAAPSQPDCMDCSGFGTYARRDNGTWSSFYVYEVGPADEPATASFLRLDRAFRQAEASLDAASEPPAPTEATPTPTPDPATCVTWSVDVSPPSVEPGKPVNVTAHLRNGCDQEIRVQGTNGCSMRGLQAVLIHDGTRYMLGNGAATTTQVCTMIYPGPVAIPAGEELVETWRWNGTLGRADGGSCCSEYDLPTPGDHDIEVWAVQPASLPRGAAQVHVTGPPSGPPP